MHSFMEYSLRLAAEENITEYPFSLKIEIICIILVPAAEDLDSGHTLPITRSCFEFFTFKHKNNKVFQ